MDFRKGMWAVVDNKQLCILLEKHGDAVAVHAINPDGTTMRINDQDVAFRVPLTSVRQAYIEEIPACRRVGLSDAVLQRKGYNFSKI